MPRPRTSRQIGFTLLELLVVIGLIGALVGLLLPMLASMRVRARDLKCQSNIRQIVISLFNYAAENKGSMPYGFCFSPSDPISWGPGDATGRYVCWASLLARYMTRGASSECDPRLLPRVLLCPTAEDAFPHRVSYAMNMIVGISPAFELMQGPPPRAQLKPPVTTLLMKDTALLWDTAVQSGWDDDVGFLIGLDIDDQRFWRGVISPQFRYWSISDPFSRMLGGVLGNNRPITLDVKMYPWRNIDPWEETTIPYQGNLRFRHSRPETVCNAGFSDGSVRQFNVKLNDDKTSRGVDALRRYFMTKWPPGIPPDYTRPW